jgi:hypothetical protein
MRKLDFHSIRDLVVYAVKNDIIQVQLLANDRQPLADLPVAPTLSAPTEQSVA